MPRETQKSPCDDSRDTLVLMHRWMHISRSRDGRLLVRSDHQLGIRDVLLALASVQLTERFAARNNHAALAEKVYRLQAWGTPQLPAQTGARELRLTPAPSRRACKQMSLHAQTSLKKVVPRSCKPGEPHNDATTT
jgi:hypothetical protein